MMIIVTGGSGSGKSEFAENLILQHAENAPKWYLATMFPFGEEGKKRIERHRRMRKGKGFETVERYIDVGGLSFRENPAVLLECMSNLTANEMFQENGAHEQCVAKIVQDIEILKQQTSLLVIVTNEIFSDLQNYEKETVQYQRYLGEINQKISKKADEVYEVVYGIPIRLKGVDG